VTIDDRAPAEDILSRVRHIVNDDFGIHHSTIQVEQVVCKDSCH
jgi:Co/Zn/Cd efflux system component